MAATTAANSPSMLDWFNTAVTAAKDVLIAKETNSQSNVLAAVPTNQQAGYVPSQPAANVAAPVTFSVPKEAYYVAGAALLAFIVVKVA